MNFNEDIKTEYNNTGPGLLSMVFTVFLVLKLVGTIDWSWWYVTMPLWIIPLIVLVILSIISVIYIFILIIKFIWRKT